MALKKISEKKSLPENEKEKDEKIEIQENKKKLSFEKQQINEEEDSFINLKRKKKKESISPIKNCDNLLRENNTTSTNSVKKKF